MKKILNEDFGNASNNNAMTLNVTALMGEYVGQTEYKINKLMRKVPKNGYLILENVDMLAKSSKDSHREEAEKHNIVEVLLKAKEITREDICIILRGQTKDAFFKSFPEARARLTYIQDRPHQSSLNLKRV
jgi:spore coat protein CotH